MNPACFRERSSSFRKAIESDPGRDSESETSIVERKNAEMEETKERTTEGKSSPEPSAVIVKIQTKDALGSNGNNGGNNNNHNSGNNNNNNGKKRRRSKRRPVSETESFSGGEEKLRVERSKRATSENRSESSR